MAKGAGAHLGAELRVMQMRGELRGVVEAVTAGLVVHERMLGWKTALVERGWISVDLGGIVRVTADGLRALEEGAR